MENQFNNKDEVFCGWVGVFLIPLAIVAFILAVPLMVLFMLAGYLYFTASVMVSTVKLFFKKKEIKYKVPQRPRITIYPE